MTGRCDTRVEVSLRIPEGQLRGMRQQAESAYPKECCGVLLGVSTGGDVRVRRTMPATNGCSDRGDRFEIPPEQLLHAIESAKALGEDVVGYYHSHPDRSATPSRMDRENAWPGMSYVILSVEDGVAKQVRSWRVVGGGDFLEEPVVSQSSVSHPVESQRR